MGPLFFIIHINDLLELVLNYGVNITLYADDTVLYASQTNPYQALLSLQRGLDIISSWCIKVRLWVSRHDHPWVRTFVDISLVP